MKDFKKISAESDWVALVNYQLSDAETELINKAEKTEEDIASMGELHARFEEAPSASELELLNAAYRNICNANNISEEDFTLQGGHVTIENNKIRGVVNLITTEDGNFKQLLF